METNQSNNVQALAPSMAGLIPENSEKNSGAIDGCQQRFCSPVSDSELTPYTMLMGIESARESNQLFESPLDPLMGKSLSLLSFPPHSLLHYTSTKGESFPRESHLQAIRAFAENHSCYSNKEQLFVPLSVALGDGREMIGLLIHREHGSLNPVFLGHENKSNQHSHLCIDVVNRSSQNQLSDEFSASSRLKMESTTLDIFERESQQLFGSVAFDENRLSQENVKSEPRPLE